MENGSICYKCGAKATSREHIPPLCLFPESKDTRGLDFRKNLLTVPSCDEHNSKKSKDDEFLMISIAGILGNNFLGYYHTNTKITRALRRKSKDFLYKTVIRNAKDHEVEIKSGKKFPILSGLPDFDRLDKCFELIACGLFFQEYGRIFNGQINMQFGFLKYEKDNLNTLLKFLKRRFELLELPHIEKGDNPDVFKYQFSPPDHFGMIALKMTFYFGTEVYVAFNPDNKEIPFDLAIELMKGGIPTVLTLGDDQFEFNKESNKS